MPNLRVLYDNAVDRATVLTADTTAGTLVAADLLTDDKTEVHRSTAATVRYTLQWASVEVFNIVALAFCNLKSTATMRARVYTNTADVVDVAVPARDSGAVKCCAYAPFGAWHWGMQPLGVNAYPLNTGVNTFPYDGGAYARVYFAATLGRKLVIDVTDPHNTAGYIEAARLIAGAYWSPASNAAFGPALSPKSNTAHKRTDAGNLRTERRPISRSLRLDLTRISAEADRARLYQVLRGNGMVKPVFLSLLPEDANPVREQSHQIYGKLSDTAMTHPGVGLFTAPLEIEEI